MNIMKMKKMKLFLCGFFALIVFCFLYFKAFSTENEENRDGNKMEYFREIATRDAYRDRNFSTGTVEIINEATREFPRIGRTIYKAKILDLDTRKVKVVAVDEHTGEIVDEKALIQQEREEKRKIFGKLEPRLKRIIDSKSPMELIPVLIWLKEPESMRMDNPQNLRNTFRHQDRKTRLQSIRNEYLENSKELNDSLFQQGYDSYACQYAPGIIAELPAYFINHIQAIDDVLMIYYLSEPHNYLKNTVLTIRADKVWEKGYKGSGVKVAVLESGAVANNGYFTSVSYYHVPIPYFFPVSDHTTVVASIIASNAGENNDNEYKGVAHEVPEILSANMGDKRLYEYALSWAINSGAHIINCSMGFHSDSFDAGAKVFDKYAYNTGVLLVAAAGNYDDTHQTYFVDSPAIAYNVLAVGAFSDSNDGNWVNDTEMLEKSCYLNPSYPPGNDREKPELAAVGDVLAMGMSGTIVSTGEGGTSAAAPQVSGLAALLINRNSQLAFEDEALRAIVMASAVHNIDGPTVMKFNDGYDDKDGAGSIDCKTADDILLNNTYLYDDYTNDDLPIQVDYYFEAPSRVRAAIAWSSFSDGMTDELQADFDLRVINPSGQEAAISASFDNNYEIVDFNVDTSGYYRIEITGKRFDSTHETIAAAWVSLEMPVPELNSSSGAFNIPEGERGTVGLTLQNKGCYTPQGYLSISVSTGLKIVDINGFTISEEDTCGKLNTSGDIQFYSYHIGCEIYRVIAKMDSINQLVDIVAPYDRDQSRTFSVTVEAKPGSNGTTQWIKYRCALLINDYPDYVREPTAGETDQQGWYANRVNVGIGACTDAFEENNSNTQAYGPLNAGAIYNGKICSAADVDWFKIVIDSTGTLSLSFTPPADNCYNLDLYNSSLSKLQELGACGVTETLNRSVSPDTYYIKIYSDNGNYNVIDTYALSYYFNTTSCSDGYEPNETWQQCSGPYNPGTTISAKICTGTDVDWYGLRVNEPGRMEVTFTVPNINCYDMDIYDPDLTLLGGMGICGGTDTHIRNVTKTGTYYLKVYGGPYEYNPSHSYQCIYKFIPGGCTDNYETNNTAEDAYGPIYPGTQYIGKICSSTDIDWFKLNIQSTGIISLTMTVPQGIDYELELFDAALNSVAASGGAAGETEHINHATSRTGWYYVKIWGFQGAYHTMNPYNLTYSFTPKPTVLYTVTTVPSSLSITVDGKSYTSPQVFNWLPDTDHTIAVSSVYLEGPNIKHIFDQWSDNGPLAHLIHTPADPTTYTANFNTMYSLVVYANPQEYGNVNPQGFNWYDKDTVVPVEATANSGYDFMGWSGDGQGIENPLPVIIDRPKEIIANFEPECTPPDVPANPSPPNGDSLCFTASLTLTWTSNGAESYDVYFGASPTPPPVGITLTPSLDVVIPAGGIYYWKIVAKKSCEETPGPTWQFTVITPPEVFSYISPANGVQGIAADTDLDWDDSSGALSYDVYFGTSSPPAYIDNTIESFYDLSQLECQTQYYWKIVAKNPCGSTDGEEYHFFTEDCEGPHIFSLNPLSGRIGTQVNITGTNFGTDRGVVIFNNNENAPITSWSDSQIHVVVPAKAVTGPVFVRTTERKDSNEVDFTVLRPVEKGLLADDFENYAVGTFPSAGGWQLINSGWGTQYQVIDNSTYISSLQSFKMEGSTNWAASIIKEFQLPNETPTSIYYQFQVKVTRLENPVIWSPDFRFWAGTYGGNSHNFGSIDFQPNQLLLGKEFLIFNGMPGPEVNLEQWYKIKVKYDLQNDTGDVWLDDALVFSQVPLGTTSSHYFEPALTFEGGNDCHTRVWVDDVNVWGENLEDSTLTVTSPNGGERWEAGSTEDITWSSTGYIDNVNIEFSADGGVSWEAIAAPTTNDGLHQWTVPEGLSANCLIRIGDIDGTPADVTDGVFSIVEASSVTLTSPNGGESLEVGASHNITWNTTGMIASIKIEYSIDNGSTWKDIAISTANNGSFKWNVPDNPSDNCLVRISDNDGEGNASDVSDAVFSIVPSSNPTITVISPNGGESLNVGETHKITWRSTGTVGNVKIEYSPDKGSTWRQIVVSTPNDGGFSWQVPAQPSETCLVRISETDGEPADISDAVFTVAAAPRATITVTSPNGGENLVVGEKHEITWTSTGSLGDVKIEYSIDRGNSWSTIVASTTNDGSYNWTVPNSPSAQGLLQISEIAQDQGASDVSDSAFSIVSPAAPTIIITSPNGGESLIVGSSHPITWTSTGSIGNIKIEYSADGGNSWEQIIASMTNDGLYNWTVPDKPSGNCLIRVSKTDGYPSDISDEEFSIAPPPVITIISPNGGENWEVFSSRDITWTSSGNIDKVKIEYSTDMGTSWTTIVTCTNNSGSYSWTIPDTPSNQCRIRISDCGTDEGPSDTSDSDFSIISPTTPAIVVTFPNDGEKLAVGSLQEITWASTGTIGSVKIEYSTDGGNAWVEIIASMTNDGSYDWEVPNTPSEDCLVRVSETDGEPVDVSDTAFSIVSPSTASITVTAPNGGEILAAGSSYTITWTSTGSIENVIIEYSNDAGATWRDIVTAATNDGSYEWIVPDESSGNCLVRISGSDLDSEPSDVSDSVFEITGEPVSSITVTAPNGGEGLIIDSTYEITWHSTGTINLVDIEYSTDNGSNWINIAVSFPNNGSYNWTVPDTPSDKCLIRVRGNDSDKGPWDVSDAAFSIITGEI